MQIATWNVNSIKVRLEQVLTWLEENPVDALCLQETKCIDENFPADAFKEINYVPTFTGQKTYNGVATLTKKPVDHIITNIPDFDDESKRFLSVNYKDITIVNVYVPNGQSVDSEKYRYKLNYLTALKNYLKETLKTSNKIIVLGDFNIAPADRDVHDPIAWKDKILCSDQERAALQAISALGLTDTYRQLYPEGNDFSWWDYRAAGFRRNLGLRIDLILASKPIIANIKDVVIDKTPRKKERPSDHAPVVLALKS